MKVITPGHKYELASFEQPNAFLEESNQTIQFIEKVQDPHKPTGQMMTVNNGTTNEEVLAMLIDRMQSLNSKFPCRENAIVITHLETALLFLEKRTRDRHARNVEGMAKA